VVGSALLDDRVARRLAEEALRDLLETRLVVAEADAQVLEDVAREVALDDGARGLVPRVQVDGAEHRLVHGGEDRDLVAPPAALLSLAEAEEAAESCARAWRASTVRVHERRPDLRQLALARVGEARHEQIGHREAKDRVAEELELLVVLVSRRRAVRERRGEMLAADEAVPEDALEDCARSSLMRHATGGARGRRVARAAGAGQPAPRHASGPSSRTRR
jgi:hypothetical protein